MVTTELRTVSGFPTGMALLQEGAGEHSEGTAVRARVLDVSKAEGIVDLSLRTELIAPVLARTRPARGKRKAAAEPSMPSVRAHSCCSVVAALQLCLSQPACTGIIWDEMCYTAMPAPPMLN